MWSRRARERARRERAGRAPHDGTGRAQSDDTSRAPGDGSPGADARLREAFAAVPREGFLREPDRAQASYDGPLSIGYGQTNSQPRTVADMLRLLEVQPGQRVLDVGAGSGWTTALLARLVGPDGSVLGLELVPEIARWGASNLQAHVAGRADLGQATLELADPAELGRAAAGPYDRILVSAMARRLPEPLVDQLTDGGRMVCPVDGEMLLVQRDGPASAATITSHGAYRFVPLIAP